MVETKDKPNKIYKQGLISISVWIKQDQPNSYTIQKTYKDKEGDWKFTSNLNVVDLHLVKLLTAKILSDEIKVNTY